MTRRGCVILSGRSGAGKTTLTERLPYPTLQLDSFFKPASGTLPRWLGAIDWDHIETFDLLSATTCIEDLLTRGQALVPKYDLASDRQLEPTELTVDRDVFIAEGVFAPAVYDSLSGCYIDRVALIRLDAGPVRSAIRKVKRDVEEGRLHLTRSAITAARGLLQPRSGQSVHEDALVVTPSNAKEAILIRVQALQTGP